MTARKLAIFVEGQTEAIFVKRLVEEIAGKKDIDFHEAQARHIHILNSAVKMLSQTKYHVLIVDCGNDEIVKSRILENRDRLIERGYALVLGLRDLKPRTRDELPRVMQGLRTGVPTKDIQIELCLAVQEIEAWFLQEANHYARIDKELTAKVIATGVGFNPETDNAETVDDPATLLRDIYRLVGKSYTKTKKQVERTVNVLDYENLYLNLPNHLEYLKIFLDYLDGFVDTTQ